MNILRDIISRLSSPTKAMWVIYIISAAILIPYNMAVDSWMKENPIKYTVVDKSDGQIEAHDSKRAKNYSLVYYVQVKYDNGGFRSISMEDPFAYKSYQMGTMYTITDSDIRNYEHTGIVVPWYMEWIVFFFVMVYIVLFGCIGGIILLTATAYEIINNKTFWNIGI